MFSWSFFSQFLLVDLRCHGDSASMTKRGPHTVASTALDVLKLVSVIFTVYHCSCHHLSTSCMAA